MMLRRMAERAWGYYRLYGLRRFLWAVGFKLKGELAGALGPRFSVRHKHADLPDVARTLSSRPSVEPASRPAKKVFRAPFVVVIGDLNLPQCKKYRVLQKLEALESLGIASDYSHCDDFERSLRLLQTATFVIFYRTRMNKAFRFYLDECERLRIPNAYDIDDPIFSEDIYRANRNLAHLDRIEREALLGSSLGHLRALEACDTAIVSTPRLVEEVRDVGKEQVFLWRNAIDKETLHAVSLAVGDDATVFRDQAKNAVEIVYASGSRAHEEDFRVIEDDIVHILDRFDNVTLSVIGYLNMPERMKALGNRISVEAFADYETYIRALARADISVIPLVADVFNDCKSAIRYMEASLVATPSVVSRVGDFMHVIEDGEDGYLASSSAEWREHLEALIADRSLRGRMGDLARERALTNLTVEPIGARLPDALKDLIHAR